MSNRAASRTPIASACFAAALWSLAFAPPLLAEEAVPKSLFPDGPCSGVLCGFIGGSQTSLFREGECGGVLCDAIGGPQAPKHAEAPPPCGGGLLCDLAPYKMGVPVTAAEAARRQAESERQLAAAAVPAASATAERATSRHHARKARGAAVKSSDGT